MYKLFFSPGACSLAPHIVLHELKVEHEAIRVDLSKPLNARDPEFLKANPRGQVPVLVDGDIAIREGAAIMIHLADKHQSPLLPREGLARAKALEWLCWGNASLHPAYGRTFWIKRNFPEAQQELMLSVARGNIQALWDDADKHLGQSEYLAGDQVTLGDILMTVIAGWNPENYKFGPNAMRVIEEIRQRPSFSHATAMEQGDQKKVA